MLDLEETKRLCAAATEGTWIEGQYDPSWEFVYVLREDDGGPPVVPVAWMRSPCDRALIAHARTTLPALVAEVERLQAESDGRRRRLEDVRGECRNEWLRAEGAEAEVERLRAALKDLATGAEQQSQSSVDVLAKCRAALRGAA